MKKTILITCIALVLLSFVSCNLDNNGILLNGLEKVPSDNKNRSFIGYDKNSSTMYYVTVDGLVRRAVASSDEPVISNDSIFTHYYQALGWLQDEHTIGYMTDSAGNNGGQYFYSINPGTTAVTPLEESGDEHEPIVDVYMATGDVRLRLVGDNGTVYSATISDTDNSITIEPKHASNGSFVSCTNGLIRYSDGKYWYEGAEISGLSGTVKAFATNEDNSQSYAITTSGSSFYIYSISGDSATQITTISGGDNNEFPCFVDSAGNLYFLYYRGTRSSSIVYKVSRDGKTVNSRDLHKNNIMAEAFVQSGDTVYMLSKDNNLFEVTI